MMEWTRLISDKCYGKEYTDNQKRGECRTQFQRDYDRLIFSAPFRRLQNKTQVFPLPGSVFVHNRLTHSLEVSSVGRSLGSDVGRALAQRHPEMPPSVFSSLGAIVSAACLAHDMGNPPFGHSGESALSTFFSEGEGLSLRHAAPIDSPPLTEQQWADLTHFDGNANAFRILTHQFHGRRKGGFVMTYSTLASIVKYPHSSLLAKKNKFGFFESEEPVFRQIAAELGLQELETDTDGRTRWCRHPLAFLVEAADDICYQIMDIEDAYKLRLITPEKAEELLLSFFSPRERDYVTREWNEVTDKGERVAALRAHAIGKLEHECAEAFLCHEETILDGRFHEPLIRHIEPLSMQAYETCSRFAVEHIYRCRDVVDIELAGHRILSTLLSLMTSAALHPERSYSQLLLRSVSSQYLLSEGTLYERLMGVMDYVTGMTDVYALDIYRKINGMSLPHY